MSDSAFSSMTATTCGVQLASTKLRLREHEMRIAELDHQLEEQRQSVKLVQLPTAEMMVVPQTTQVPNSTCVCVREAFAFVCVCVVRTCVCVCVVTQSLCTHERGRMLLCILAFIFYRCLVGVASSAHTVPVQQMQHALHTTISSLATTWFDALCLTHSRTTSPSHWETDPGKVST